MMWICEIISWPTIVLALMSMSSSFQSAIVLGKNENVNPLFLALKCVL